MCYVLRFMCCVLRVVCYVLCVAFYVLHSMFYVLCVACYKVRVMFYVLCFKCYVLFLRFAFMFTLTVEVFFCRFHYGDYFVKYAFHVFVDGCEHGVVYVAVIVKQA